MKYADVIVDISIDKLDKTFQYSIPKHLEEKIAPGVPVVVPFGNRNITGFVIDISEEPKFDPLKTKDLLGVQADAVSIMSQLVALAAWMKKNYGSTMNQALKTVLPIKKEASRKVIKILHLKASNEEALSELASIKSRPNHSLQKERLLEAIIEEKEIDWDSATHRLHVDSVTIRALEKKGLINVIEETTYRNPIKPKDLNKKDVVLNAHQQAAVDTVVGDYDMGVRKTYLLHGVTGSGKTEVYMEILSHVLEEGKQAIVLIPEIALTYQTVSRFYQRFGDKVSILNSRMSPAERYDQLLRAKNGDISIMVGPRSALFSPFENLGLIIIDEEHESSYKSETVPKYHARETAIERARMSEASVILGSATPSVESFYKAKTGEYKLLSLPGRAATDTMAHCQVVDLREELRAGNKSILSRELTNQIQDRLDKKEQVMLFLNRRGMMGFISCRACGHVIKCPHCDVSLSLHKNGKMVCHYCGHEEAKPSLCPECGSKYIGGFKVGTEKVEEIVSKTFPGAKTLRMDMDTTKGKDGHEKILSAFANHEADILVGTQMIVKGHDFENVTLVGVLAADMSLNDSDYRSGERTFQLLTQAVGRAGRGQKSGDAIIQTYKPDHYAIEASNHQDYLEFYEQEIAYRDILSYPPCGHMLAILITSKYENQCFKRAAELGNLISSQMKGIGILGPTTPAIGKINDIYRQMIYIKDANYDRLVETKDIIENHIKDNENYKWVSVWFDFDPMNM